MAGDRYGVLGTTWTKQKPDVVRRSALFAGSPDIPSSFAIREMANIKERSAVRTTPRGPHPTAPLEAIDRVDVEVAVTVNVRLVEIFGAQYFVISF